MTCQRTIVVLIALVACLSTAPAQRWEQVSLPTPYNAGYYLDVFFLPSNPNYGWACDQNGGYVIRTTDGGATWQGTQVGAGLHLEYIQFLDTQNGYCTGPGGAFKSTNGGQTWTSMAPTGATAIWGAWFRDVNNGWMTGGGCGRNTFWRTQDGGTTWTSFLDTLRTVSKLSDPLWTADMPAGRVYAVGNQTLWRSDDDGATWAVAANIGATNAWMEELAKFGTSWAVPLSPDGCPPGANDQGMRFSEDDGATWRQYNTGRQMFGTFLLSAQSGWAAGYNKAVFFTSNGGRTWEERSCGIAEGHNLDDIFFIDQNKGWVVGSGVYRLAKPIAEFSKDRMAFGTVCPDTVKYDTVWVTNKNFFKAGFDAYVIGPDSDLFGILGSVPDSLGPCERFPLVIRYSPSRVGLHTANLTIEMTRTDTTFNVALSGDRRDRSAAPIDTVLTMQVRVGTTGAMTHRWRAISTPIEEIVSVTRLNGDTNIVLFSPTYPVSVFTDGALLYVNATVRDTGWVESTFRVRLGPCRRDTIIKVRVYGLSPIMTSVTTLEQDAKCQERDTFMIPVANTGNFDMIISTMRFSGPSANVFGILGWTSGTPTGYRVMKAKQRDTLLVLVTPTTGDDRVTLEIDHDDNTRTRGNVDPWLVQLRARSSRANVITRTATIDVGQICVGRSVNKMLDLLNDGIVSGTVQVLRIPPFITGMSTAPFNLPAGQTRSLGITIHQRTAGPFTDTITFVISPCDDTLRIPVKGNAGALAVRIDPRSIIDSVRSGSSVTRTANVFIDSTDRATITSVRLEPTHPDLLLTTPQLPAIVTRSVPLPVSLRWTGNGTTTYRGVLIATAEGACDAADTIPVTFTTYLTDVQFSSRFLRMRTTCAPRTVRDSIVVRTLSTSAQTLDVPTIMPNDGRFVVVSPTQPVQLSQNSPVTIVVDYVPSAPGRSLSVMSVTMQPGDRTVTIDLEGSYDLAASDALDTVAALGVLDACLDPFTRTFTVRNEGNVADTFSVQVLNDASGMLFNTGMDPFVVQPGGTADVTLLIEPVNLRAGVVSTERLALTSMVCGSVITLAATAEGTGGRLDVTPSRVTVGPIALGATERATITVRNVGSQTRRLSRIALDPVAPWTIVADPSPLDLLPNEEAVFDVVFTPTSGGTFDAAVTLTDSGTCVVEHRVDLRGTSIDQKVVPEVVQVRMDDYVRQPNVEVDIPLHWDRDVTGVRMDSLNIVVTYNHLLIDIDTLVPGSWGDVARAAFAPGRVELFVGGAGPTLGAAGTVCVLRGTTRSAVPDSTSLAFARVAVWSALPTDVRSDDGSLVVDACGPRFMITFGAVRTIRVAPPSPTRDVIALEIEASADALVDVDLVDLVGNVVVHRPNMAVQQGTHLLTVPVTEVASGQYILRVRNALGTLFAEPRLIVR